MIDQLKASYLLLFFSVFFYGCYSVPEELKISEQLIETHPDSALHLLQKLPANKLHGRYNRALYALLKTQALDKNDSTVDNDSLISIATGYFDESDPIHAGYAWFYHSRTAAHRDSINEQARNLLKAQEFADKTTDYKLMGLVYGDKADMYTSQNQSDSSICYSEKAYNSFRLANDYRNSIVALFSTATEFMKKSQFDSVRYYYRLAEKIAKQTKDKVVISYIYRNIGITYYQQQQYSIALKNYWNVPFTGIKIYDSNKYYLLGRLYVKIQQLDSAQYYLHKVSELGDMAPDYYRVWESIYEQKADRIRALHYANKVSFAIDSLYKKRLEKSFAGLEKKYKFQGLQISNQNLTLKNKQRGLYLLLSLLILAIIIGVVLYWRLQVKQREAKYQKDIADQRQELIEKKDNLLKKEQETLAKEKENSELLEKQLRFQAIFLLNIEQHRKNSIKRPGLWKADTNYDGLEQKKTFQEEMIACMDLEYGNISLRLKTQYPALSQQDILICCLLLANFDNGMIATVLDVQIDSIKKQRYRLRAKLNLQNSDNLVHFIRHF